ncbi:hypothetical protein VB264_19095 [Arcicella aquatica]|uniref:Outer membrane protein beta-barrel domain-containing protein n=1 Tax=Arcicella aquatica TaxID=217141 RepID=A0ABU5QS50_9BACT|nr:hypothetical protein [Arcicella aquatica]MEA5259912.1 hypothetical protein [Arcicella aquatica]
MSDKWWDMSDDELDDLIREASDKVEIPFDQSSLDKLKNKLAPQSAIIPKSRYKYERWLLLLFLLCFVSGITIYYFTKNNLTEKLTTETQLNNNQLESQKEVSKASKQSTTKGEELSENITNANAVSVPDDKKTTVQPKVESVDKGTVIENKVDAVSKHNEKVNSKSLKTFKSIPSLVKNKVTSKSFTNFNYTSRVQEVSNIRQTGINSDGQRSIDNIGKKEIGQGVSFTQGNVTRDNSLKTSESLSLLTGKPLKPLKSALEITLPEFEESSSEPRVSPLVKSNKFSRFGVRLSIAPDANGVESLAGFALGKSAGILFEYNITKRIVIQTGAVYSSKKYSTGIENYHAWAKNWATRPVLPTSVEGDCQILDIPFNIRYNVLQKAKDTWFVSAGASSYLMLTEGYEYYYPETATVPPNFPRYVSWKRDNDYFMSSLNISFGFEKRINNHLSIQAEPYLKAPLKEVGRGKVNLYSSGIMFSLKYGF